MVIDLDRCLTAGAGKERMAATALVSQSSHGWDTLHVSAGST